MIDPRTWLNRNPLAVTLLASGVLCVAVGVLVYSAVAGSHVPRLGDTDVYYMDLETGQWFRAPGSLEPPESPAGNRSAHAVLYACGSCDNEQDLIVGHLTHDVPVEDRPADMSESDALLVSADGEQWFPRTSPQGAHILRPPQCSDNSPAQQCRPGD